MTKSLSDLIAEKDALERQIRAAQESAKLTAIASVHRLMLEHGLTLTDLQSKPNRASAHQAKKKVAPKFCDPSSGATWSGRGLKPKWLVAALQNGGKIEDFAVPPIAL